MPKTPVEAASYRARESGTLLVVDFRRYREHRGNLLWADRILLAGRWTPLVRVRVRHSRVSDGATEI